MPIWPIWYRYGLIFHCGPDNRAPNTNVSVIALVMQVFTCGTRWIETVTEDDQIFPFYFTQTVCLASCWEKLAARIRQTSDPSWVAIHHYTHSTNMVQLIWKSNCNHSLLFLEPFNLTVEKRLMMLVNFPSLYHTRAQILQFSVVMRKVRKCVLSFLL